MTHRQQLVRAIWENSLQLSPEDTPVAICCVTVLPNAALRVSAVNVEPEQCEPMALALEQLAQQLREHARAQALAAGPAAQVVKLHPR